MLHKTDPKRCSCFIHYFLFYAIFVAYLPLTGCFGPRTDLIPKINSALSELSDTSKKEYITINEMLRPDQKKKFKQKIDTISKPDDLQSFIKKMHQNCIDYNDLLKLLTKSERTELTKKFDEVIIDVDAQAKLIEETSRPLQMIEDATMQNKQDYIDLLELLPDNKAIALKNKIVKFTNPKDADQFIKSQFDTLFKQLDDKTKAALSKLRDTKRQEVLRKIMNDNAKKDSHTGKVTGNNQTVAQTNNQNSSASKEEQQNEVPSNNQSTNPGTPNNSDSTTSSSELDVDKLIQNAEEEEEKEEEAKKNQDIQDDWGPKIPLEGDARKEFKTSMIVFDPEDQKKFKELADQVDPGSMINFFYAYENGFNKEERIELLSTIITLYKGKPELTIKMCNRPNNLSWGDTFAIGMCLGLAGVKPLYKLQACLS